MGVNDCIALLVPFFFILWPWLNFQLEFRGEKFYIDLIFSGKTNQHSVKWGDSRDTRVSNYSAKSLVWGFFLSFFISEKMIFMFSCKCVLAYGNKYLHSISCIRNLITPLPKKLKLCYCPLLKKKLYFSNQTFWTNSLK